MFDTNHEYVCMFASFARSTRSSILFNKTIVSLLICYIRIYKCSFRNHAQFHLKINVFILWRELSRICITIITILLNDPGNY